jgi:hypothetical protein
MNFTLLSTVPFLLRSIAGLSPRRPGFDPRVVHVRLVLNKVGLGLVSSQYSTNAPYSFTHLPQTLYNVFLPVLQFPLSVSTSTLHSQLYLPFIPEGQVGKMWELSKENVLLFRKLESVV